MWLGPVKKVSTQGQIVGIGQPGQLLADG
jgi:hypothetical protein